MGVGAVPSGVVNVLAIQNDAIDPIQLVGTWLTDRGITVDVLAAWDGVSVPRTVPAGVAGIISLGGAMNANADDIAPWLPDERALLADAVAREIPVLGLCLGGQLLAAATGGRVELGEQPEIGVVEVERTVAGQHDPVLGALPADRVVAAHWHQDYITQLPPDATVLLTNATCPVQAFRVGETGYGLQMHPEVTPEVFASWGHKADEVLTRFNLTADDAIAAMAAHTGELTATWEPVIAAWAELLRPHE
jgi:GMP synthase (glutamine-hydrolysing)